MACSQRERFFSTEKGSRDRYNMESWRVASLWWKEESYTKTVTDPNMTTEANSEVIQVE